MPAIAASKREAIRDGPLGWYVQSTGKVKRVFWTCSAAWALDTMDGFVYQYLIPVLISAFGITLTQAGAIASANYFSSAIGGWAGGWLSDRFGRARMLQITILWFAFFSFLSGFAQTYEQLLVIRVFQGLGFGAEWAVGAVLLGEMVVPKHRGKTLGTVHSGAAIGSGLAALLAGPVVALFPLEWGWRVVFWIGLTPAVLIYFVRRGRDDSEIHCAARARAEAEGHQASMFAIFRPGILRITALASVLALGAQGAGYAVSNYLTTFLESERGLSGAAAGIYVLFNSLGGFMGFIVNAYLSDRVGRRMIFRMFGVGFILAVSFYLYAPLSDSTWALLAAGVVYGFFQFGIYASFGPYFSELFPTEIRANGQAFAYNFGRASTFIFIQGVALIAAFTPLSVAMTIMGVAGVSCAIIATLLMPETVGCDLSTVGRKDVLPADTETLQERARDFAASV